MNRLFKLQFKSLQLSIYFIEAIDEQMVFIGN